MSSSCPSDIIVIGAGIVGCAAAYELARRGASVRVLDDRPAGMGATQASAGMLAPFTEAKDRHDAFLDLAARSLGLYDDFVARVTSTAKRQVGYARTGTLEVATTSDHFGALRQLGDRLEARGVAPRVLDALATRAEEPGLSAEAVGGLLIGAHGFVNAGELTQALITAARCHGAEMIESPRVQRLSRSGSSLIVETAGRLLSGDAVVLAAGSWSGRLEIEGVARPPVHPVRGQLLHLRPRGTVLRRVIWGERCYLVPWENGTVLVGATMEDVGFDEGTTVAGVTGLLQAACMLVPSLQDASVLSVRAGLRPATPDSLPIIGPSRVIDNLTYATGHFRNGVLLAPVTAQLVADAVLAGRTDPALDAIGPQRFEGL